MISAWILQFFFHRCRSHGERRRQPVPQGIGGSRSDRELHLPPKHFHLSRFVPSFIQNLTICRKSWKFREGPWCFCQILGRRVNCVSKVFQGGTSFWVFCILLTFFEKKFLWSYFVLLFNPKSVFYCITRRLILIDPKFFKFLYLHCFHFIPTYVCGGNQLNYDHFVPSKAD